MAGTVIVIGVGSETIWRMKRWVEGSICFEWFCLMKNIIRSFLSRAISDMGSVEDLKLERD
jgi:hypothetical protein